MTIHEFGKKENPVILLLPGTMCHWKGNFDGVIDKLAEDFLAACVAYTGFDVVFEKLQKLETLQYIAMPYATFEPVGLTEPVWTVGSMSAYRFRLFGVIPFGTHKIHNVRFEPEGVSSREGNERVPMWNHDITMISLDDNHTKYTDRVEIQAGWKTFFIWLWANAFYTHRQRKWIRLLKEG